MGFDLDTIVLFGKIGLVVIKAIIEIVSTLG
jgi:hypothetical protein